MSFTFIDLFAGIGGIRRPFTQLGGKCVFSSEIDKYAAQTYEANWHEKPSGDITQIASDSIPDFDILLGGFPCQAFSIAGKRMGFNDTRGTLFFQIARIIKDKQPKAFLLENVKGLLSHDKGKTFEVIKTTLEQDLGYKLYYKVLNAKDYGVPQNRERIIMVGFRDHDINFFFPEPFHSKTRLGDILEANVDDKYTLSDSMWHYMQNRKAIQKAKGNGFGYSLFTEDSEYTSTISARYYKDGSEILLKQEGKNPRRLTPRECARLQGFEDSFKLVCSDVQTYKQLGNSVPTKMIGAVAKQMLLAMGILPSVYISDDTYSNNLLFYMLLKGLVQIGMTQRQLITFQDIIQNKSTGFRNNISEFKRLVKNGQYCRSSKSDDLYMLINTLTSQNFDMWRHMMDCAIEMVLYKDLILAESKAYVSEKTKQVEREITDKLSLKYDVNSLEMPYGQRVVSALLVSAIADAERDSTYVLAKSNKIVKSIGEKLRTLINTYDINCSNMLLLIVDESTNQSIKSSAGTSYEDRVYNTLFGMVTNLETHTHDTKIPSVEYDDQFEYRGIKWGVSAKRTLRERYKQNHEHVEDLDVNYIIVITLGVDLNEEKVNLITSKHGNFILVAQEVYEENEYMKNNKYVFSSADGITNIMDSIIDSSK